MANRLDIVAIRIKYECRVIVCVILRAKPRRSVVTSASGYASGEECVDIRPRDCIESDVDARCHRRTFG